MTSIFSQFFVFFLSDESVNWPSVGRRNYPQTPVLAVLFSNRIHSSLSYLYFILNSFYLFEGSTVDEMVETLRFSGFRDNVHSYSEALLDIINAADKPYELSSANRLYGRTGMY